MTLTNRKIEVVPVLFGLLYKVVEHCKLCNGYYERWYSYTKTLHCSYETAQQSANKFK
ncbi:conserved hypothetical protein [Vibrio phage 424E50-1]|nr:conserved hypothetical protein [Vibrio phage 424E50-1]